MPATTLLEDLLKLGASALGGLVEARHDIGAKAREKLDCVTQKLDLVTREEFDAAFAMLAKSRAVQEELIERITRLENKLGMSSKNSTKNNTKKDQSDATINLRSVKQGNRKKRQTTSSVARKTPKKS